MQEIMGFSLGRITVGDVVTGIIASAICILAARIILRIINRLLGRWIADNALRGFLRVAIKLSVYFVAILVVAYLIGVPVASFIAAFGVVGLAVSLAAEKSLANIAGGVLLLATKPFAAGDFVEAGEKSGTVREIGLVSTKLLTVDNKTIYIPNADISSGHITNFTREETRRVDLTFTASYDSPSEVVMAAIREAAAGIPKIMPDPAPFFGIMAYRESSVEYVTRLWTKTGDYWEVYFAMMERVPRAYEQHGVRMTYNHLNVHVIENGKEPPWKSAT